MSGKGRGRRGNPLEETCPDSNASISQLLRLLVEQTGRGNGQSFSSRGPSHDDPQEKFRRQKPKEFGGNDPEELSHFVEGMKPMFKMNVRLSMPKTYREAVDRAMRIERD
ncbi:hypothetical protein F511_45289 [Dorcoceras hygrometricum]|uniref:Uncharacterized protein n=1 Tax=Dorcoceras hygrometricum TaxID=472368 RepID=A0A2Z6ZWK2_9LAMI|nr:hypothetical protein F511_45289 [Dorcoceras hygrometricum]